MRRIKLSQNLYVKVDDADYKWLNQWHWYAQKSKHTYYAVRTVREKYSDGSIKNRRIIMHRLIMGTPKGIEVDHIDHDGLNCQRNNMRNCTTSQNSKNKSSRKPKSSKYLGVDKSKYRRKYRARIMNNGQLIDLGYYLTEESAAYAYDVAAKKYHGEFANLNFK